jgi:hypothetical protein
MILLNVYPSGLRPLKILFPLHVGGSPGISKWSPVTPITCMYLTCFNKYLFVSWSGIYRDHPHIPCSARKNSHWILCITLTLLQCYLLIFLQEDVLRSNPLPGYSKVEKLYQLLTDIAMEEGSKLCINPDVRSAICQHCEKLEEHDKRASQFVTAYRSRWGNCLYGRTKDPNPRQWWHRGSSYQTFAMQLPNTLIPSATGWCTQLSSSYGCRLVKFAKSGTICSSISKNVQ